MDNNYLFKNIDTKLVDPFIDLLIQTFPVNPPPGSLISDEIHATKTKQELNTTIASRDIRQVIERGLRALSKDLTAHLTKQELEKITEEMKKGAQAISETPQPTWQPPLDAMEEADIPTLQELMHISEETLNQFYKSGIRIFNAHHYADAADTFCLMSFINFKRHNIWLKLGKCRQQNNQFESALEAYAMAIIVQGNDVWPYIYSAECYLALNKTQEARECLNTILSIRNPKHDNWTSYAKKLLAKC